MFKKNEGMLDRQIRVGVAVVSGLLGYFVFTGTLQTIAYVLAIVALVTSIVGFCGLYALLGINTCSVKTKK